MTSYECYISSNCKYYLYHIIVFVELILTFINLYLSKYKDIDGFILSTILLQVILFCLINTNNNVDNMTICEALIIGYSNFANLFVLTPYIFINMRHFEYIKEGKFYSIYILGLLLYVIVVIFLINTYYFSNSKFIELHCFCITPPKPTLPIINIPTIKIPTIKVPTINVASHDKCNLCDRTNHKIIQLDGCSHSICSDCLSKIQQTDENNNKLCPWCRKANIK